MPDSLVDGNDSMGGNLPEFTVSEVSGAIRRVLEGEFSRVRVRGEVGRVSRPSSGHVYLDLKDSGAVLASVIWKGSWARLEVQPVEGDEVVAEGRLTTFPGQSRYQLIIEQVRHAGQGALLAKLERLKKALEAEGLFAAERKRPIPFLPGVVGVITSPTGAVIRDILHRLADRFPRRVLLWPVAVQGQACAREVAAAVAGFNALPAGGPIPRPDVLIVARGGGSVEDLWGFNEEIVVRAVAASTIPVISAVGHETDTTLIDYAADRRAPTPTAAAEMAVPVRRDLAAAVAGLEDRRQRALRRALGEASLRLTAAGRLLPSPDGLLGPVRQRLDRAAGDLPRALRDRLGVARLRLARGAAGRFGPALLAHRLALRRARLEDRAARLAPGLARLIAARRAAARPVLARLAPRLVRPAQQRAGQALAAAAQRLDRAAGLLGTAAREGLAAAARLLETLSYRATLARGFAVVRTEAHVATRAHEVPPGARLSVEFADGRIDAVADGTPRGRPASRSETKGGGGGQGSLF
jgi:exodeoxyribonuclease VII large subunit